MSGRKRVLVADDNEHNRDLARQVLADRVQVLEAEDGIATVEGARREQPDLVLVDLSMPGLDGWSVARALKADPTTARIPLVALTAHAMAGDRERALATGFDGYLAKPYRARELIACIEAFLGPQEPAAEDDGWSYEEGSGP